MIRNTISAEFTTVIVAVFYFSSWSFCVIIDEIESINF